VYRLSENPFEKMKIALKPGEYVDPDRDEKMEKAKRRAAEFIRDDDDEEEIRIDTAAMFGELANKLRIKTKQEAIA